MYDDPDARTDVSEVPETTENEMALLFRGDDDRIAAIYSDVPSAFWLAPNADLTVATPVPAFATVRKTRADAAGASLTLSGRKNAVAAAMVAAGPTFSALALMFGIAPSHDHWFSIFSAAIASLIAWPLTVPIGAILSAVPIVIGTFLLSEGGKRHDWLQHRGTWAATGAAMSTIIAAMFDASVDIGPSLICTGMVCASIARHAIAWDEPKPRPMPVERRPAAVVVGAH